jgi:hypothetical protein
MGPGIGDEPHLLVLTNSSDGLLAFLGRLDHDTVPVKFSAESCFGHLDPWLLRFGGDPRGRSLVPGPLGRAAPVPGASLLLLFAFNLAVDIDIVVVKLAFCTLKPSKHVQSWFRGQFWTSLRDSARNAP